MEGRRAHLPAENVAGPETQLRAQWGFAAKPFEPDRTQGVRQPGLSPAQVPCTPVHTRVPLSHTPHCWPALRDLPQGPAGLAATSSPSPPPPEAQQHPRPCAAPEPWRHETPCGPRPDSLSRAHVWTAVRWLSSSRPSSPPLPRATWVRQVGQCFQKRPGCRRDVALPGAVWHVAWGTQPQGMPGSLGKGCGTGSSGCRTGSCAH